MINTTFADTNEKIGYEKLKDFNSFLNLKNLNRMSTGHWTDASGTTQNGKIANIELKNRNQKLIKQGDKYLISGASKNGQTYIEPSIIIESHKAGDLLFDYLIMGYTPLYINFLEDNIVVVYNLARLNKRPTKKYSRNYSGLRNSFEIADREELDLTDSYIYRKTENNEYKCIYKPDVQ
jgi:hypothetical protein